MLIVLLTHPIQYQVPLWRALAADGRVPFEVWYLTDHGLREAWDPEFGRKFSWDLPLLEGYPHRFIPVNRTWVMDPHRPHALRLAGSLAPLLRARQARALLLPGWHKLALWQALHQAHAGGFSLWLRAESNDLSPVPPWRAWLRRRLHRAVFRRIDHFLCIGSANRRLYARAGVPATRLWPAPYGVDNARFAAQAAALRPERAALRHAWGIPPAAFCVLFCGKLMAKKRPLDLVAAAARLRARTGGAGRPLHLLFAGTGELEEQLRGRCAAAGAASDPRPPATFAGFLNQTEISRAYVAADCLALPSDAGETWGLVVNEALASGLPAVASAAAGCAEDLVAPLDERLRFPVGDIDAFADALAAVERTPPSADALSARVAQHGFAPTLETLATLHARGYPRSVLRPAIPLP